MNRVCIHQPDFLPYLGFFHRLLFTDTFIVLDDVQFLRRGWHHRDKIKTRQGEKWLTLPVQRGDYLQRINQVLLSDDRERWVTRHLNLLKENYKEAPNFDEYFPKIGEIYQKGADRMVDLNMDFLNFFFQLLDLKMNVIFSSDLKVEGSKNQKLIRLVQTVSGTHYLSGIGARAYLDEAAFADEGITVEWQQFHHPVYPQRYGDFIPNLSCIDLLFNCGRDARNVLESCLSEKSA